MADYKKKKEGPVSEDAAKSFYQGFGKAMGGGKNPDVSGVQEESMTEKLNKLKVDALNRIRNMRSID